MAKLNRPELAEWYDVARRLKEAALIRGDSLFTPGKAVWTLATLQDLHDRYVVNADEGDRSFVEKLNDQLANAASETRQLMAEVLYLYYLPMGGNFKQATKQKGVEGVLAAMTPPQTIPADLLAVLDRGIARESQSYNQQRYFQLRFYIESMLKWWSLPVDERVRLLSDPWAFRQHVESTPVKWSQASQQMLLHIVHPDTFEPVMSNGHKKRLAEYLAEGNEKTIDDLDRRLLVIRERLTPQRTPGFSLYEPDLRKKWQADADRETVDANEEEDGNAEPHTTKPVWKIAPGGKGHFWRECRDEGMICIGWPGFGDVGLLDRTGFDSKRSQLIEEDDYGKGCRVVWTFAKTIKRGDTIVANRGKSVVLGIGTVVGDYYFEPNEQYPHRLKVQWTDTTPRAVSFSHWNGTLIRVSDTDFALIRTAQPIDSDLGDEEADKPKTTHDDQAVGVQPTNDIVTLLLDRMNVVLHGPPGTGKTHTTLHVADLWKTWQGPGSVSQVTFHPSYAYEDFIEGFRPDVKGRFVLQSGVFVNVCEAARKSPKRRFLLIIDELNRGDVARIFGELITLIERDKRSSRASRTLPYSRREFHVPPNLYLLGTMNTADRSISLLDIAIRRRFCFVESPPDVMAIRNSEQHHQTIEGVELEKLMLALNARLQTIGVERDRAVGHSHFLIDREAESPLAELRNRVRHDILPLIEEHCYANRSQMSTVLGGLVRDGVIVADVFDNDARFIEALQKLCDSGA